MCTFVVDIETLTRTQYYNQKNVEHCGASDEYAEIVYFGREVVM